MTEPSTAARSFLPTAYPGQFTFVMATGIVSTALSNTGAEIASLIIFTIAVGGYLVLAGCWLGLLVRAPVVVGHQLRNGGFTILAVTAASGVLAARFAVLGTFWAAITLTIIALVTWLAFGYFAVARAFVSTIGQATTLRSVDGTWFLWVVATQSVAVSAGALAHAFGRKEFALIAALCWSIGILQLIVVAALVGARLLVAPIRPSDEVAPYWVFMGSGAISVLAGAELLAVGPDQSLLETSVIATVSMALWSLATWLLPLLIAMMIWHRRLPGAVHGFRTPLWSMVFPIGMYGEASRQLGAVRGTHWLDVLGTWESWIALAVWLAVFVGMVEWWWAWLTDRRNERAAAA